MHAKPLFLAIAFLLSGSSVIAATTGEALTEINTDIEVLEIQVKRDDLRLKQLKQKADMEKLAGGVSSDYQVVWVEGLGKKQFAQLVTENGNRYEVRNGDKLPGGLKVVSIAPNEVLVEDGAKRKRMLSFAPAWMSGNNQTSSVMSGMPGSMPQVQPGFPR